MKTTLTKEAGITVKELAVYLGASEYTIRDLVRRKRIPSYRVGNRIFFRRESILKWLNEQEEKSMLVLEDIV